VARRGFEASGFSDVDAAELRRRVTSPNGTASAESSLRLNGIATQWPLQNTQYFSVGSVVFNTPAGPVARRPGAVGGRASYEAVRLAASLSARRLAAGFVTGPVSKEAWRLAGAPHLDHTAFLKAFTGSRRVAMMLGLLFAGLRTGVRAWDAGTDRGDRADQLLLTFSFVRKELSAAFPWRFKDATAVRLAFVGERERIRFVSCGPRTRRGGLAFVSFEKARQGGERAGGSDTGAGGGRREELRVRRGFREAFTLAEA
jgi:hypothetical protein